MVKGNTKNIINGWINLDKDKDLTSTQALGRLKRILNVKKAGHAGTLDPLATGCLPVALGECTKVIQFAQNKAKIYEFEVTWGQSRTTDDLEGEVLEQSELRPELSDIENCLPRYCGKILQTPPQFAAVKINGKRAYEIARAGEKADIEPREVCVNSFKIINHDKNVTRFQVQCGKGVYIRSLARDLGNDLTCYGFISELRRLSVGPFDEKTMITLDNLEEIVHSDELQTALYPPETMLDDIPALDLTEQETARLKQGQKLGLYSKPQLDRLEKAGIRVDPENQVNAYARYNGRIMALIKVKGVEVKPARILNL